MNWVVIVLFLSLSFSTRAQTLLVNGGFEEINVCTEYRMECAPEAWISSTHGFANYFRDGKRAYKSMNCMAIEAGNFVKTAPNNRSFIRSRLLCGLRKGAIYRIEFYLKSFHDIHDSIGVWFTDTDPLFDKRTTYTITPSVFVKGFLPPVRGGDSTWKRVELLYEANGEERYAAFGYFAREEYIGDVAHPLEMRYFAFLDDISMTPVDPNEHLCSNWMAIKEEIYEENERHNLLEKKIKYYRTNPPPPLTVVRNSHVRIDTLVLPDILFGTGKATLQPASSRILDSLCRDLTRRNIDSIVVEGHTDSTGTEDLNQRLSEDRAAAVSNYIKTKTGTSAVITRGLSSIKPVAANNSPAGRQRNRRVEVLLYIKE